MINAPLSAVCVPGSMVLGSGCDLSGTLRVDGDLRLMGRFDGQLEVGGLLEVGPDATLRGRAVVQRLRAAGVVEASVDAALCVVLCPGGELRGGVNTPSLQTAGESAADPETRETTQAAGPPSPGAEPQPQDDKVATTPRPGDEATEAPAGVLHRRRRPTGRPMAAAAGR